ncbi:MAG: 16S rRNA (adenine(1518)-N(6)/adenine(1519)-N(6))-dimethyltransferase, partial [Syntrophomonadaceae bacterium]
VEVHNEKVFKDILRTAFQMRRKTILNSSSAFFQISKSQAQSWLEQIGIKPNQRPEELSLQDFARLVNRFLG